MIELIDIQKTYRNGAAATPVLMGVSFRVEEGECVAIMGASGSGKTTLMNIVGCLDTPSSGTYLLDGTNVFENDDNTVSAIRNRKIGFVFQQFHLLERTSALDNVLLPLVYADKYPADAPQRARAMLEAVGLGDRVHYRPGQLSGGQQQRVAIARALVTRPSLILADEPTGNLDRRSGLEVIDILQKLNREGRTIVLITHDQNIAEHARRILTLSDGRIVEESRPSSVREAARELETLPDAAGSEGGQP
ncbi:MAG: ABC transporter ATP-binding protein [Acidobacteria bacterium]|nr:ABC transporter ATP-binding protein [Acidobacteriota bacterium]